eukprot:c7413_g2_i1 orf=30-548(-)
MEATALGLRVFPSLASSPAAFSPSRRLHTPQSFHLRPLAVQSLRILASVADQEGSEEEDDERAGPSFSNLSAEDLEQKLGKRRRSRKEKPSKASESKPAPKKDWESMTFAEKAVDFYVGEKGALFWLNKIAYAAIFVIVGAWIAFRFVGPALNLYQLESPLLPPDQVFGGSK